MARPRGNKTSYTAPEPDPLEEAWKLAMKNGRDLLLTLYPVAKRAYLAKAAVRCADFHKTLNVLAQITGDGRFEAAAQAMQDNDLLKGGDVKQTIMDVALKHRCFRASWVAMDNVHLWVKAGTSVEKAAKLVAVELGIPGTSFAEVVKDIRQNYPRWLKEVFPEVISPPPGLAKPSTK
jgi:hypothetical protein